MNYRSLSKELPKDLADLIGSYLGVEYWQVRSNYKQLHGVVTILGLLKKYYLSFASYEVEYDEKDPEYHKDIKKIYKIFDDFYKLLKTEEVRNIVYRIDHSKSTQFTYRQNINLDADICLCIHKSNIFFMYKNLRSTGTWVEECVITKHLAWFYQNPPICLCCKAPVDILDGPMNSYIPTECPHYLNTTCWEELFDDGRLECPLCFINVEDWLYSSY
jgi:hypothetical protein